MIHDGMETPWRWRQTPATHGGVLEAHALEEGCNLAGPLTLSLFLVPSFAFSRPSNPHWLVG